MEKLSRMLCFFSSVSEQEDKLELKDYDKKSFQNLKSDCKPQIIF